jgi:hypothetical protein
MVAGMGAPFEVDDVFSRWLEGDEFNDFVALISQGKAAQATDTLIDAVITLGTGVPIVGAVAKAASSRLRELATGATARLSKAYALAATGAAAERRRIAFAGLVRAELRPWFVSVIEQLAELRDDVLSARTRGSTCKLRMLGERESGTGRLEEAVQAYRNALREFEPRRSTTEQNLERTQVLLRARL